MAKKLSSIFSEMFKMTHRNHPHYSSGWEKSEYPKNEENKK